MNHKDKSKDGDPARKDLELLNLKPDLWLTEINGKVEHHHHHCYQMVRMKEN